MQRHGKAKQKFQFTLVLEHLDLGVTKLKPQLGVQWTRGGRTALSKYRQAEKGVIDFENEELTLVSTLFKRGHDSHYEKKRSKIAIKQRLPGQKPGREKRVGVIELNLNEYVGMDVEHSLALPVDRCRSSSEAVLFLTLKCVYLKATGHMRQASEDDASLISGFSMMSHETTLTVDTGVTVGMGGTYEIQDGLEDSGEPNPDVANMDDLQCFDSLLASSPPLATPPHSPREKDNDPDYVEQTMRENCKLQNEIHELKRKLAISGESGFSEEWQNLMSELKMARIEVNEAHAALDTERVRNKKEVTRLRKELSMMQSQNDKEESLRKLLSEKEDKIESLIKERQDVDAAMIEEKANGAELQIELSVLRKKFDESTISLGGVREELTKETKAHEKLKKKYRDLMKTINMNDKELLSSVGFFRSQADDLETTLQMVRKSWKETSNIMETQISAMNSELRDLKLKNRTMKEKLDSSQRKLVRRNAEIEKLQTHRTKMSQVLTKHEVAMASKMVELVNMNNLLQAAKDQVLELQQELESYKESGDAGSTTTANDKLSIDQLFSQEMLDNLNSSLTSPLDVGNLRPVKKTHVRRSSRSSAKKPKKSTQYRPTLI